MSLIPRTSFLAGLSGSAALITGCGGSSYVFPATGLQSAKGRRPLSGSRSQGPYSVQRTAGGVALIDGFGLVLWQIGATADLGTLVCTSSYFAGSLSLPTSILPNTAGQSVDCGNGIVVSATSALSAAFTAQGSSNGSAAQSGAPNNAVITQKLAAVDITPTSVYLKAVNGTGGGRGPVINVVPGKPRKLTPAKLTIGCNLAGLVLAVASAALYATAEVALVQGGVNPVADAAYIFAVITYLSAYAQWQNECYSSE